MKTTKYQNIESKNAGRKAASMNKRTELCNELCRLLGYQTWEIVKRPCTGDWAGYMDYSLKFEDGKELYISTGTGVKSFDNGVSEEIEGYKRISREGYKSGDYVRMKKSGNIVRVVRVGLEMSDGSTVIYLYDDHMKPSDSRYVERHNIISETANVEPATADEKRRTEQKELDELREAYKEVEEVAEQQGKDWSSILNPLKARIEETERRLATLEQPSEISDFAETLADDLKEGDRVLVKELGVLATVVDTSFCYTVEYDSPIDRNGHTYTRDTYGRDGLTKNFDPEGVRVKQPAMAFHLQDKVILGADMLGESRPHAVGCIVTGYKWSVKVGEFMYQLQGEDGKQYWDFERNIIPDTDTDGGRKATLEQAEEITDIPAADLVWDEDKEVVKVWGNIESHRDNLERMGGRRGRVVFTNNKTGLPTGADCYTFRKDREADIREYVSKTHDRISRDFRETYDKHGDRGHEYHEGERVVTIYGRGTVIKTDCCHATELIDVRLDAPTYNYIWSLAGTPQRRVAVNRDNIVSIELPEPPAEVTLEKTSEITAEPTLYERHNITAEERRKRAEVSAQYIRRQARMAREAFYHHKGARIETSIAYRNDTDDPDKMSYKVCWYDETRTGRLHLVDCENGISLGQAARHMADFALLTECGLTLREILYPAA